MAVPRKTAILYFQPYTSVAIVNGEHDRDTPEIDDVEVKIWNALTGDLIVDHTAGAASTNVRITGLSMVEGDLYRARMRYQNSEGWGEWSANAISRVPANLPYDPLTAFDEPQPLDPLPFQPDFVLPLGRARPAHDWDLATGHIKRRPKQTTEREWVELIWGPQSISDRDTLLDFLRAKIDAAEGFILEDPLNGDLKAWPRAGTLEYSLRNMVWRVRVEADQTRDAA